MSAPVASSANRPRRCTGAFRCYAGSSRARVQGLLGRHYPRLWDQIAAKWIPSARPIEPGHLQAHGDYSRATLADVLTDMGENHLEWDGFDVCRILHQFYGWACDFHLAALIHAWSVGLSKELGR